MKQNPEPKVTQIDHRLHSELGANEQSQWSFFLTDYILKRLLRCRRGLHWKEALPLI